MRISFVYILVQFWALLMRVQAFVSRSLSTVNPVRLFKSRKSRLDMVERKTVCVVGGGFGGLYSALTISRKMDAQTDLYLIEPKERFAFLPLLYELAVGTAAATEVAPRYKELLKGTKVKFIRAVVEKVDFEGRTCSLKYIDGSSTDMSGDAAVVPAVVGATNLAGAERSEEIRSTMATSLSFDQLVIASGVQPRLDLIPGAKEHALPFYRVDDAFRLKNKLKDLKSHKHELIRVAVIGGGYSGVEVATNVAQDVGIGRASVTMIDRNLKIMQTSPAHNRDTAERSLAKSGVNVYYNTSVQRINADSVSLVDRGSEVAFELPADLVIFTAGTEQSLFIRDLELEKDPSGRILTRPTLQSKSYPYVFALGDCSSVEGQLVPSTAQVAMQQSGTVASNILRNIKADRMVAKNSRRKPPALKDFKFVSLGEMLTLGDTNAAVSTLGGYVKLSGPLAAAGRRAVYAVRMPTTTQTVKALVAAPAVTAGKLLRKAFTSRRGGSGGSSPAGN